MRDFLKWCRNHRSRFTALSVSVMAFAWLSLELWRTERHYAYLLSEVRSHFQRNEQTMHDQFATLMFKLNENQDARDGNSDYSSAENLVSIRRRMDCIEFTGSDRR